MTLSFFDAVHADPWASEFVDLPTLNAKASGAIESAIERTRKVARSEPRNLRSTSLVVLGPPGAGKTHLFTRLRRRLGPRAVFVHIRPLVHAEITPRFVLGEIVRQLGFETQSGLPQVSALVGSLLGHLSGVGTDFPSTFIGEMNDLPAMERDKRLADALSQVLDTWQEADEIYVERLLAAPFASGATRRALLAWLSGGDCETAQLERIGATASLGEDRALSALRSLSAVAALGAPIVLVFDQLENLVDAGSSSRMLAFANVAAELIDTMRGLVVVQMALDTEWERAISPSFNLSQRSRLVMQQEALELPDSAQREELLRLFVERIPERPEAFPWPLGEAWLARLRAQPGSTPRMLLVDCKRALAGERDAESVVEKGDAADAPRDVAALGMAMDAEWARLLHLARQHVQEVTERRVALDPARLADGVMCACAFASGLAASGGAAQPARLVLESGARREQLAILQEVNHRSLAATLGKLTSVAARDSVVVLREQARELPPTWKETLKKREALLATGRARWIDVGPEDSARILALDSLLQAARSGDVTDAHGRPVAESDVRSWVQSSLGVEEWHLLAQLASTAAASDPEASDVVAAEVESSGRAVTPLALLTLGRLRIASVDRLVREVSRVDRSATRTSVLAELEGAGTAVEFVGRAIVYVRSQA